MAESTLPCDTDLLTRFVRERDSAAFEALVLRHGPMVLQACQRVLHNAYDAEDAAQAVFLTLAQQAPRLLGVRSLAAWLHRVAFRLALDLRRSTQRRRTREMAAAARNTAGENPWLALQPYLDDAIDQLPEKYRLAVLLHHLQGHTQQQAADLLGCSPSALSMRLTRARDLLRRRLMPLAESQAVGALFASGGTAAISPELATATAKLAGYLLAGHQIAAAGTSSAQSLLWSQRAARMLYLARLKAAAAVVAAAAIATGGTMGVRNVLAGASAERPASPPATRPALTTAPSTAPETIEAYLALAFEEAARTANHGDQDNIYQRIAMAQLAAGDIAAAQQTLARVPGVFQSYGAVPCAWILADRGDFPGARQLRDQIEDEGARRWCETFIAEREVFDVFRRGKPDEAMAIAQGLEEPEAKLLAFCTLAREFHTAKDAQGSANAIALAEKALPYVPGDTPTMVCYLVGAKAFVGDLQGARTMAAAVGKDEHNMAYGAIAVAQTQSGDIEGAMQTLANVRRREGAMVYADCAQESVKRNDPAGARRFVQRAMELHKADHAPDNGNGLPQMVLRVFAQSLTQLGDVVAAKALVEACPPPRAAWYHEIAQYQTLREGPAAAYAWAKELKLPLERANAYAGIAQGLAESQRTTAKVPSFF